MRRGKNVIVKLAGDAAFVAVITLVNRCLEKRERVMVPGSGDGERLNRRLTMVSLVYHAIGIFYNE
jgi:hypothetical protein